MLFRHIAVFDVCGNIWSVDHINAISARLAFAVCVQEKSGLRSDGTRVVPVFLVKSPTCTYHD